MLVGDDEAQLFFELLLQHADERVAALPRSSMGRPSSRRAVVVGGGGRRSSPAPAPGLTWLNDSSSPFSVAASSGWPVSWISRSAVNAWSAGLATTRTTLDVVPLQALNVWMWPTKTPSS